MRLYPNYLSHALDLSGTASLGLLFNGDPLVFDTDPLTFNDLSASYAPTLTYVCQDCDIPDKAPGRIIDITPNPDYDPGSEDPAQRQFWLPIVARVPACGKDWKGVESYVDYDFGTGGSYHRILSREFMAAIAGLADCDLTADLSGHNCKKFPNNLVFSPGTQRWIGSIDLATGTLGVEVFATYDGDEHWFVEYTGCGDWIPPGTPNVLPGAVSCHQPLRFGIGFDSFVTLGCCGPDEFWTPSYIHVQAMITPIYLTKLVEAVRVDGSVAPVATFGECCDLDLCPLKAGCCNRLTIDSTLDYTISNFTVTGGGCDECCAGPLSVTPTDDIGCISWSYPCTMFTEVVVLCLQCDSAESVADDNRGWEHYRLFDGANHYAPEEGDCDTFNLVFRGVSVTVASILGCAPGTTCTFTYDVTITR